MSAAIEEIIDASNFVPHPHSESIECATWTVSDVLRTVIVMQANALREAEEQLKHQLVYGGYPELWEMMLRERMKIKQERAKAERDAIIARRKLVAQRLFAAQIVGGAIVVVIFGFVIILVVRQVTQ